MKSPTALFFLLQSTLFWSPTQAVEKVVRGSQNHMPTQHKHTIVNNNNNNNNINKNNHHVIPVEDASKLHQYQEQQHSLDGSRITTAVTESSNGDTETSFVYLPHNLAQDGYLEELKKLLHNYPALLTDRDNNGWTLMHEVARGGHVPIAEYLISMGADKNAQSLDGFTPLHEAHRFHGPTSPITKYFESQGAVYDTPKQRLRGKQEEIVKNYAHSLAGRGKLDELKSYVKAHGNQFLRAPDANGWTLLHEAARFGQIEMAVYLVEQGVDMNCKEKDGNTALQVARKFQGEHSSFFLLLKTMSVH
jgi:ankyrin repeat protein